jgi:hypothetical protein
MDFDDFFDDYENDSVGSSSDYGLSNEQGGVEKNLDPFNFHNPVSAYLFLSDDVQDELENPLNRKLKCLLCGHRFLGRKIDQCPECYGSVFSEII